MNSQPLDKPSTIAVCLIVKNEARYLAEWIEYHLLIGVDHIFIYDNNSEDDVPAVCRHFADAVTLHRWPLLLDQQRQAYAHFSTHYGAQYDWCAFIDADEFIVYRGEGGLRSYLAEHHDKNGLLMEWRLFGTNGHVRRPDGFVLENYTRTHSISPNPYWKTLCRPQRIDVDNIETPHNFNYRVDAPIVPAKECDIVLYHYILRSVDDIYTKILRGDAWSKEAGDKRLRDVQIAVQRYLEKYDSTDVEDNYMHMFIPELKRRLDKRFAQP